MRTSKLDLYEALVKAIREADIDPEDMRDDLESAEARHPWKSGNRCKKNKFA